jgi:ubiquinone/menaquinone biosynthesis C-methylase UbiE
MLTKLLHRIVSIPRVYDTVQKLAGRDRIRPWIAHFVTNVSAGMTVLDVGAGTGELLRILSPTATYIWLDNDLTKLSGARAKFRDIRALLGNADQIGLKDKSVDVGVCIAVSHHLTDVQFDDALRELVRVCRMKLIFVDPIWHPTSALSKLLWKYDRGSNPRSVEELRSHVAKFFEIEQESRNSVYHHYWLCTGSPKR